MRYILIGLAGLSVATFLLWHADRADRARDALWDCVYREARADGHKGDVESAWATYSQWCANKN